MDPGEPVEVPPQASTWRSRGCGAAALVGVAGLAITQPVLDLFGKNPEFFVAGRYNATQIVVFALLVAFAPGLVAVAAVRLAWLVHPRAGVVTFALALAGFAFLFGLVVLDHLGVDAPWAVFVGALALAGFVVYVTQTASRPTRSSRSSPLAMWRSCCCSSLRVPRRSSSWVGRPRAAKARCNRLN